MGLFSTIFPLSLLQIVNAVKFNFNLQLNLQPSLNSMSRISLSPGTGGGGQCLLCNRRRPNSEKNQMKQLSNDLEASDSEDNDPLIVYHPPSNFTGGALPEEPEEDVEVVSMSQESSNSNYSSSNTINNDTINNFPVVEELKVLKRFTEDPLSLKKFSSWLSDQLSIRRGPVKPIDLSVKNNSTMNSMESEPDNMQIDSEDHSTTSLTSSSKFNYDIIMSDENDNDSELSHELDLNLLPELTQDYHLSKMPKNDYIRRLVAIINNEKTRIFEKEYSYISASPLKNDNKSKKESDQVKLHDFSLDPTDPLKFRRLRPYKSLSISQTSQSKATATALESLTRKLIRILGILPEEAKRLVYSSGGPSTNNHSMPTNVITPSNSFGSNINSLKSSTTSNLNNLNNNQNNYTYLTRESDVREVLNDRIKRGGVGAGNRKRKDDEDKKRKRMEIEEGVQKVWGM